jgi:hypothetical protein
LPITSKPGWANTVAVPLPLLTTLTNDASLMVLAPFDTSIAATPSMPNTPDALAEFSTMRLVPPPTKTWAFWALLMKLRSPWPETTVSLAVVLPLMLTRPVAFDTAEM